MLTIREFQTQQAEWQNHNFPEEAKQPYHLLFGLVEELGELSHAQLKYEQKIRGSAESHAEKAKDAVADIIVYLAGFCNSMEFDLDATMRQGFSFTAPLPESPTFKDYQSYLVDSILSNSNPVVTRPAEEMNPVSFWLRRSLFYLSQFASESFDRVLEYNQSAASDSFAASVLAGEVAKMKYAIGWFVRCLLHYCVLRGFDMQMLVEETWAKVRQRDWRRHPENAHLQAS